MCVGMCPQMNSTLYNFSSGGCLLGFNHQISSISYLTMVKGRRVFHFGYWNEIFLWLNQDFATNPPVSGLQFYSLIIFVKIDCRLLFEPAPGISVNLYFLSFGKSYAKGLSTYHIGPIGRRTGCLLIQGAM